MKRGPANESVQVAAVGSIWDFGDKTDGTVIDCIQFIEQCIGGYFVNDIVEDREYGQFYKGMFGSISEGCFVAEQEANSRFNLGLEMFDVSLEGEFSLTRHLGIYSCPHILIQNRPEQCFWTGRQVQAAIG